MNEKETVNAIIERVRAKFRRVELDEIRQVVWLAWLSAEGAAEEAEKFACTTLRKQTAQVEEVLANIDAVSGETTSESVDVANAVNRAVIATIDKLGEVDRKIFYERFVLKKTLGEIALHVDRCQSTVHYRLKGIAKIFLKEYSKYDN